MTKPDEDMAGNKDRANNDATQHRLAFQLLLGGFPSQCFSVPTLTCPFPSLFHLFLIPLFSFVGIYSLFFLSSLSVRSVFICVVTFSAVSACLLHCLPPSCLLQSLPAGMFLFLVSCFSFDLYFACVTLCLSLMLLLCFWSL